LTVWPQLRAFKARYHLLRDAFDRSLVGHDLGFSLSYHEGALEAGVQLPGERESLRFAQLIAPFAHPRSELFFPELLKSLLAVASPPVDDLAWLEGASAAALSSPLPILHNGNRLQGPALFAMMGDGSLLGQSPEAAAELGPVSRMPGAMAVFEWAFHAYCHQVMDFLGALYCVVRAMEASSLVECEPPARVETPRCIYCLSDDGSFTSVEHVLPEAMGNQEVVLPQGVVCDRCNNETLSRLDQYFIEQDAIKLLIVFFVPLTKKGRYPTASNQQFTIARIGPRELQFTPHGIPSRDLEALEANGEMSLNVLPKRPFEPVEFARSLFKFALGLVAHHCGHAAALHSRYDEARQFVMGGPPVPTYLVLGSHCTPTSESEGALVVQPDSTWHCLNVFGWNMCHGIEPMDRSDDDPIDSTGDSLVFWLGASAEPESTR
jgi:hypothetical protein